MALGITLIAGLSLLIGIIISIFSKQSKKLSNFAIGMAFTILIGMCTFDLIPEMLEHLEEEAIFIKTLRILVSIIIGLGIFKVLDKFVPHHHDHSEHDDSNHLLHIGLITSIVLVLHNIIEGIAIYSVALTDIKSGLIMCLGVALHNIPLGIEVGASINNKKMNRVNKVILIFLLTVSTSIGALIINMSQMQINDIYLGTLIAITLGMVLYLLIFEILKEVVKNRNNKYTLSGALIGIVIVLMSLFL